MNRKRFITWRWDFPTGPSRASAVCHCAALKAGWPRSTKNCSFQSLKELTDEAYEKLAYNVRTRAFFEALRRGLLNNDELEKASEDLEAWIERDQKRFNEEQKAQLKKR